jgi:porin
MNSKLLLSSLLLASSTALVAADAASDSRFADRLTGDWGGARSQLADQGVEVFAYYNAIVASNVDGGIRKETNFAGDLFTGFKLDLEKLVGWDDTTFTLSAINRAGSDITPSVGSQYSVMQLVGGQTTFLYNVTLEKLFRDGDLSVKLGRMTATDDFVGSPLYGYSLNNAVNGQIRAVLFDGVMTSYPFAVWGGRVKAKTSDNSFVQVGVFQISSDMFDPTKRGLDLTIASDDGVSVFTQFDWNPEFAGKPAHFFVGLNNTFFIDLPKYNSAATEDRFTRFYAHGDYQVYRESADRDEGLTLFATFAYTPQDDIAIMPLQSTFGAHYKGLLPGRPDDRTVAFVTYGKFSDEFSAEQVGLGGSAADYEMVFEVGHRVQLTKYAYIQPDIQFIKRPGGTGNIDDAIVLGVQFGASF